MLKRSTDSSASVRHMSTVLEIIDKGTRYLEKRGIENARLNMQLMVAQRLACSRMQLYLDFDRPLKEDELSPLREDLKRRGEGIPLQHITGNVEFHNRNFLCDSRALIPRPETEELVSLILQEIKKHPALLQKESIHILDLCTGSGVIGLSLAAELPNAQVTCSDLSEDALALAKENRAELNLPHVSIIHSDGFQSVEDHFDIIACNPPYIANAEKANASQEVNHDPELALYSGEDGLDFMRQILPESYNKLNSGGFIALEIGYDQASATENLLSNAGYSEISTHKDLNGIPRFPIAHKL